VNELVTVYTNYRRGKDEPRQIQAAIEALGGRVLEHRQISRLVVSPFSKLRAYPLLYEFRVDHGRRRGFWYVRTSGDEEEPDWVWSDLDGYKTLPVEHPTAQVAHEVRAVGWIADAFLVGAIVLAGVLGCLAAAWMLA
jgi:hypothetical protein